jgi:multiple sugar transport system substrate-binding protein
LNMIRRFRLVQLFLSMFLLVSILTGCTNGAKDKGKEGAVEIVFWQPDLATWQPLYEELIKNFNDEHPNIRVKMANIPEEGYFEKMNTAFAAGKGPDMWVGWYSVDEYARGYIAPIDDYIQMDKFDMDQYFQPITEARLKGADGKYYGLPRDASMSAVLYNKDIFDKYNVPYPKDDWTLEDFRSIAAKLTHPDDKIYGTDMVGDEWGFITGAPLVWNMGSDLISEDGWKVKGIMDSPETIMLFEYAQSVLKDGSNIPSSIMANLSGDHAGFTTGTVAMSAGDLWGFNTIKDVPFNWGVVTYPRVSSSMDQYGWLDVVNWHMNAKSKHKDETWEFMKYMSSEEVGKSVAKELTWGPPLKQTWIDAGLTDDEHLGVFYKQGSLPTKTPIYLRNKDWYSINQPFTDAAADMLNPLKGKEYADPKAALGKAADEIQAKLDELKSKKQ